MRRACPVAVAGFLIAGCALPDTNTVGESFGPRVTNECNDPVIVGIGDSVAAAERNIREAPTTIQPGVRSMIDYFVQSGAVPDRVFLLVGVGADSAAMLEFKTSEIRDSHVETVFDADCHTLRKP